MKAYLITMFIIWILKAFKQCVPDYANVSENEKVVLRFLRLSIGIGFAIWTGMLLF